MKDQISENEAVETENGKEVNPTAEKEEAIGKFSNKDELYAAYSALEKEFTRRSQRLKTLEKQIDDLNKANLLKEEGKIKTQTAVAETVSKYPNLLPIQDEIALSFEGLDVEDEAALWCALGQLLAPKYRSAEDILNSEGFLEDYVLSNKDVVAACAERFFDAKSANRNPKTVGDSGRTIITPPKKPKSLREAKQMAEDMFK